MVCLFLKFQWFIYTSLWSSVYFVKPTDLLFRNYIPFVTGDLRHGELSPFIGGFTVTASPHERFCFHFHFLVYIICDNLNYIYNYKLYKIHFELTFPFTDEIGVYWRLTFENFEFWNFSSTRFSQMRKVTLGTFQKFKEMPRTLTPYCIAKISVCNYIKSQIGLSNRNVNPKWDTRIYLSHTVYCILWDRYVNRWTAKWRLTVMVNYIVRMVQAKR